MQVQRRLTLESSLKAEKLDVCMAAARSIRAVPRVLPVDGHRRQPRLGRLQRHHELLVRHPANKQGVHLRPSLWFQPPCPENNFNASN